MRYKATCISFALFFSLAAATIISRDDSPSRKLLSWNTTQQMTALGLPIIGSALSLVLPAVSAVIELTRTSNVALNTANEQWFTVPTAPLTTSSPWVAQSIILESKPKLHALDFSFAISSPEPSPWIPITVGLVEDRARLGTSMATMERWQGYYILEH
ncbi:hypothetical protein D9619_001644 [Psilocybe cf. subviscida]|uniref:Uncharacterized protein n=1 Tax=Psilocybe cf. subviscida TaxID=2480587 RepID=A0A8H5BDF6_9AGAR|nr:hypothetical protein D9619_001644 [Psilocybe cf. subviscida]